MSCKPRRIAFRWCRLRWRDIAIRLASHKYSWRMNWLNELNLLNDGPTEWHFWTKQTRFAHTDARAWHSYEWEMHKLSKIPSNWREMLFANLGTENSLNFFLFRRFIQNSIWCHRHSCPKRTERRWQIAKETKKCSVKLMRSPKRRDERWIQINRNSFDAKA